MKLAAWSSILVGLASPCAWAAADPGLLTGAMLPEGWELGEPHRFAADNLWEQVNGAAPGYLRYGFRELTAQTVRSTGEPRGEVLIEVSEFADHLSAFGFYSTERAPGLAYIRLGAEGYCVLNDCRFYKGRYYVKLQMTRDDEATREALGGIATRLARALPGETRHPGVLRAFPREGLIMRSERYEGADLLAHDFLGAGFTADYALGGKRPAKLFFALKGSSAEARGAYRQLLSFLRRRSKMGEGVRIAGGHGRLVDPPFYGPSLVARRGAVVCGILGAEGPDSTRLVEALIANLDAAGLLYGDPAGPCCPQ